MHFVVTREDGEVLEVEVSHKRETPVWKRDYFLWIFPYYEIDKKHEEHSWNSYGLTYETKNEQSILTAYIDGEKVGEDIKDGAVRAHKSEYGMILGRMPYTHPDGNIGNRHFFGIMDQAGMDDQAFTPTDMLLWHQGVMKSTLVQYIRD
jgi:hypothetical protein